MANVQDPWAKEYEANKKVLNDNLLFQMPGTPTGYVYGELDSQGKHTGRWLPAVFDKNKGWLADDNPIQGELSNYTPDANTGKVTPGNPLYRIGEIIHNNTLNGEFNNPELLKYPNRVVEDSTNSRINALKPFYNPYDGYLPDDIRQALEYNRQVQKGMYDKSVDLSQTYNKIKPKYSPLKLPVDYTTLSSYNPYMPINTLNKTYIDDIRAALNGLTAPIESKLVNKGF